ncbi:MAG: hypothetical protein A4E71_02649 [Smithella sp. PtaU1.Bin162]|nr:MAG: hypothetical protein A4E71_02649 [Smithella sp. PtaU1.Bin162]
MAKFILMSPNYIEILAEASADLSNGDYVSKENLRGFCIVDVLTGADFAMIVKADKVKALKAVGAISPGDNVYYDVSGGNVTTTETGNIMVGHCIEAAASADTTVMIEFDGSLDDIYQRMILAEARITALE